MGPIFNVWGRGRKFFTISVKKKKFNFMVQKICAWVSDFSEWATEIKSILLETYLKVVLNTSIGFLANIYMQVFLLIDQNRSFFIFRKVCFLILLFWFALWDRWYGVEMRVTRGLRNCIWQAKRWTNDKKICERQGCSLSRFIQLQWRLVLQFLV